MSYDSNSPDAMFSRIMEKLENLDQKADRIELQTNITNGRVTGLERWRDVITAKVAVIASVTSLLVGVLTWAIQRFV